MKKSTEKKLLHFYTGGSIYEDFSAARLKRTAKLRRIIRVCFYLHLAAAIITIAAAVVFKAGLGIIGIGAGEVVLVGLALMSVGDLTTPKTLLYCGDIVFAAAMIAAGVFSETKTPFFAAGGLSIIMAVIALGAFFAAAYKSFLESFSPLQLKRENYTLLPNFGNVEYEDLLDPAEVPVISVPPERSEFQELSDKLREILCAKKEKSEESRIIEENTAPKTEVAQ